MWLIPILTATVILPPVETQLSAYANWKPSRNRYCEAVRSTTNPIQAGIACGAGGWNSMKTMFEVEITSKVTLGVLNVAWISNAALTTEQGFWKTCKPYMTMLFDGLWSNITEACVYMNNPPAGVPQCAQASKGFLYRSSGSGYCLKSKVCGASATIDFLKGPGNDTLLYSWATADTNALIRQGYKKVGSCYGYKKLDNPTSSSENIANDDPFYG